MATGLIEQVLKTVRNYELLKPGESVLVACSGGPDSVFLLHALTNLKSKLKMKEISVCSLDHGLRGAESKADSAFVKNMAARLGLKSFHKKVDLNAERNNGLSVEESARRARYEFFKSAAAKASAGVVATGHTLDDQAETVLMRIIKGSALKGLAGIASSRNEGSLRVIRPLLELEKKDILKYLQDNDIGYRTDRTNSQPIYFRNIVRNDIMPYLERYNPRLKRALFSMAQHLREDFEFIENANSGVRGMINMHPDGTVSVSIKDLAVQPRSLQKEILRDCLAMAGGSVKKLTFRHWKELEGLVNRKHKGSSVHLPGGIKAERLASEIKFSFI